MSASEPVSKGRRIARGLLLWVPTVLFGALMVMQGIIKLAPGSPWVAVFERFGYPDGFYLVIGVVELLGGFLLFIPRFAGYAGLMLGIVMVGAMGTHMMMSEWANAGFTTLFAAIYFALAWARWRGLPWQTGGDATVQPG